MPRELCDRKDAEIIEVNIYPGYIHMLLKIPLKISISHFVGYIRKKYANDI